MKRRPAIAVAFAAALAAGTPASSALAAERLVTSVSTHRVLITSNFTGTSAVLFGAIEDDGTTVPRPAGYDVVVTVRGPTETVVARRKSRVLGIWVNTESRQFIDVPSYIAVLSNRPPQELGAPEFLRRNRIGLANHTLRQRIGGDFGDVVPQDPFRVAFLRVKMDQGLFHEEPTGLTFITPRLFRATVPIPGIAPTGTYEVETLLLSGGEVIAREATAIEVVKTGFEELFARAARDHGFLYGLATAFLALGTGILANFLFRRE
ncbi:MAG: TIGR02186 family protein [Bradyrhizobiaceae bacterium]|nr:TIGR02186 family protein [Bradyrhizobiaceae bacterium]